MANIRIDVPYTITDGSEVSFTAPCDCTAVTGLIVYHLGGSKEFTFRDAHGNDLTGIGNLFESGAIVKALLDVKNGHAYLQNADTNAYLEQKFVDVTMYATDPKNDGNIVLKYGGGTGGYVPGGGGSTSNDPTYGGTVGGLTAEQVQAMIDAALGGIENGTY